MNSPTVLAAPAFLRSATAPVPCATQPDLFHSDDPADTARAADLCLDCPLMFACRTWARTQGEYGVAGGETEAERAAAGRKPVRNAKTKARNKGCGTEAGAKAHRRRNEPVCGVCLREERAAFQRSREDREKRDATTWPPHIAPQELQILQALADGLDVGGIAERLGVPRKTVTTGTYKLRKKLRTSNEQLVDVARGAGLLPAQPAALEYEVAA